MGVFKKETYLRCMKTIYKNARVFTGDSVLDKAHVTVEQAQITHVQTTEPDTTGAQVIDLQGKSLAPAFIDLQIYGGKGKLFNNEPTVESIRKTYETVQEGGTFAFQITLSCSPPETMWQAIDACRAYWAEGGKGLIGLHLEGPYFNPDKRGAHPLRHIQQPHYEEVAALIDRGKGAVTYMTVAPEQFDDATLDLLLKSDIHISAGHSNATFAQAIHGLGRGILRVTHLFNAMSAFQSRAPGLVGATYDYTPWASIIADGVHVDYNALKITKKVLGKKLFLITDAVTESPMGDYHFLFAGDHYVDVNGTLAGSSLSMWQAVKNVVQHAGIDLDEALRMASTYPAMVIDQGHRWGKIAAGYEAAMVVLDGDGSGSVELL